MAAWVARAFRLVNYCCHDSFRAGTWESRSRPAVQLGEDPSFLVLEPTHSSDALTAACSACCLPSPVQGLYIYSLIATGRLSSDRSWRNTACQLCFLPACKGYGSQELSRLFSWTRVLQLLGLSQDGYGAVTMPIPSCMYWAHYPTFSRAGPVYPHSG